MKGIKYLIKLYGHFHIKCYFLRTNNIFTPNVIFFILTLCLFTLTVRNQDK